MPELRVRAVASRNVTGLRRLFAPNLLRPHGGSCGIPSTWRSPTAPCGSPWGGRRDAAPLPTAAAPPGAPRTHSGAIPETCRGGCSRGSLALVVVPGPRRPVRGRAAAPSAVSARPGQKLVTYAAPASACPRLPVPSRRPGAARPRGCSRAALDTTGGRRRQAPPASVRVVALREVVGMARSAHPGDLPGRRGCSCPCQACGWW